MPPLENPPHFHHLRATIISSEGSTSAAQARLKRDATMKTAGCFLLLVAVSLAGCVHATGPCYGVGCHAFTTPSGARPRNAQSQSARERASHNSQTAAEQRNAPPAQRSHGMFALLKEIKL